MGHCHSSFVDKNLIFNNIIHLSLYITVNINMHFDIFFNDTVQYNGSARKIKTVCYVAVYKYMLSLF